MIEIKKKNFRGYKDLNINFKFKLIKNESLVENSNSICKQELAIESYFLKLNQKSKVIIIRLLIFYQLLKNFVKIDILPFTRIVIEFYIKTLFSNNYQNVFISSEYLFFDVDFQTKFEVNFCLNT